MAHEEPIELGEVELGIRVKLRPGDNTTMVVTAIERYGDGTGKVHVVGNPNTTSIDMGRGRPTIIQVFGI